MTKKKRASKDVAVRFAEEDVRTQVRESVLREDSGYDKSTVKKIGSIPLGYSDEDMVFFLNGKIYIAKRASGVKN